MGRADKRKKKETLTSAQKLRRMSLNFLPVGIALLIIGILAGIRAGRLIYVLAFTAPALSFIVMGIFFRKFPVGEDLPQKKDFPQKKDPPQKSAYRSATSRNKDQFGATDIKAASQAGQKTNEGITGKQTP